MAEPGFNVNNCLQGPGAYPPQPAVHQVPRYPEQEQKGSLNCFLRNALRIDLAFTNVKHEPQVMNAHQEFCLWTHMCMHTSCNVYNHFLNGYNVQNLYPNLGLGPLKSPPPQGNRYCQLLRQLPSASLCTPKVRVSVCTNGSGVNTLPCTLPFSLPLLGAP